MAIKVDRRVQKTRQILQKAMVELIAEKEFDSIRIQDILDKANVGRSTFYAHYQDKGELLHSCFEEIHQIFEQHVIGVSKNTRGSSELVINADFTLNLLKFAERNGLLFKALLKQRELSEFVNDSFIEYLTVPVNQWLVRENNSPIPAEIVIHYFVSAFLGTLKWWVLHDMPCTAEELDLHFKQLAMPTINSLTLIKK